MVERRKLNWNSFLNSLRTGGGRIGVLWSVLMVGIVCGMMMVYVPPEETEISKTAAFAIVAIISGFTVALVGALRGDLPKNGNGEPRPSPPAPKGVIGGSVIGGPSGPTGSL